MARSVTLTPREVRAVHRELEPLVVGGTLDTVRTKLARAMEAAPTKARPKRKPRASAPRDRPCGGCEKCLQGDARHCLSWGTPPYVSLRRWASKRPTAAEKRERRAAIREKVFLRASTTACGGPQCEGPPDSDPMREGRCENVARELQHVFGKGKGREPESERNCLAACHDCHLAETRNQPSGAAWWTYFADFFHEKGFFREESKARSRAFLEATRAALPAAPRVRP